MGKNSGFFTGQIGALIRLETSDTLEFFNAATLQEIHYQRPDGVTGKWAAGTDGTKLTFLTTTAADLPISGRYTLQAYMEGPGWALHGDKAIMVIGDPVHL
jgi:hypothetical protein